MVSVSVIIPNYNHGHFLEQRIESVLGQTFQDFELIILDDASSDNSCQVIERYRHHPKVSHIVYNRRNSGSPFRQWNKGIRLAKGKYIWVAESDDYCKTNFLEVLIESLEQNPSVGIAYCKSAFTDAAGRFLYDDAERNSCFENNLWHQYFIANGKQIIENFLYKLNIIPNASAAVFRKSVFEQAGRAPVCMRQCGDWHLWIRMLGLSNLAYTAQQLNFFRLHSHTTRILNNTEKVIQRVKEEIIINNLIMNYLSKPELLKERQRLISLWIELQARHKSLLGTLAACPPGWNLVSYWREVAGYFHYLKS